MKSLFRRGQGPSGSSKHSNSFTNQLQTSASTCSLNSIGTSTPSTSPVATTLSKGSLQSSSAIYDSHDSLDSRGAASEGPYVPPRTLCAAGRGHSQSSNNVEALESAKSHSISYSASSLQELSKDKDVAACKLVVLPVPAPSNASEATAEIEVGKRDAMPWMFILIDCDFRVFFFNVQTKPNQLNESVIAELEQRLTQIEQEKSELELEVVELSSCKTEMITVLGEMSKLKVGGDDRHAKKETMKINILYSLNLSGNNEQ